MHDDYFNSHIPLQLRYTKGGSLISRCFLNWDGCEHIRLGFRAGTGVNIFALAKITGGGQIFSRLWIETGMGCGGEVASNVIGNA